MYDDEALPPLGLVPLDGRGSLPFALVHGESLVAAASWAVGEAGIDLYDASVSFAQVRAAGRPLVLHDPLCPLTPADFLAEAVRLSAETGAIVVGFRPVTDTVKTLLDDALGATLDRSALRVVTSPVVIPAAILADLEVLDAADFAALVARLVEQSSGAGEVRWIEAPPIGARIAGPVDLPILEALSRSLAS